MEGYCAIALKNPTFAAKNGQELAKRGTPASRHPSALRLGAAGDLSGFRVRKSSP
jgi:hypothetical protein